MTENQIRAEAIWTQYRRASDWMASKGIYSATERAHRFFEGDQWYGLDCGGEELPSFNFIEPVVRHKVATVASNGMGMTFTPADGCDSAFATEVCTELNDFAGRCARELNLERIYWDIVNDACVAGNAYLYLYSAGNGHFKAD